ncbi:hypothetical protein ACFO0N_02015 [Halobium salinum]|uniref:Uncharacterized protein n=1 Tax=Halobium salinum TaxID=1364940 RepID=A0ABD5P8B4_9EURY|nr:hypothetical protein [Halobium salinum]
MGDRAERDTDVPEETYDELAGVVDLFGALTRAELERALDELAFKQGADADTEALAAAVDDAVERYYLVEFEPEDGVAGAPDGATLLAVGPVAFPVLPENAEDLPLILDVPERTVDRAVVGERAADRLVRDAEAAVSDDEADGRRLERLLDVAYDVEAWAPVEATAARETLDEALEALEAKSEGELE